MKKQQSNKRLLALALVWLTSLFTMGSALAQNTASIKGLVQTESSEPLNGVSVTATNIATKKAVSATTNEKGMFSISTLQVGSTYNFTFSYVGYEAGFVNAFKIKEGNENSLLVRLKQTTSTLDQVVVVGYGSQQKKFVTGSVSKIGGESLNTYSASSFAQQLQGKAAGVVINETSGQPGTDPLIMIRGIGTLTAGKNPLIVVDGFPLTEGSSFNSINPQDIESIDILKDPASAAIYGSRAANGVIMITTKKGKTENAKVAVDVYAGYQQRSDNVKLVNAYDAATYFTEARDNGYLQLNPATNKISDDRATRLLNGAGPRQLRLNYIQPYLDKTPGLTNTNWLNEVLKNAQFNSFNFSVSGNTSKTNYYLSANYFNQEGLFIENGLKRFSGVIKVDSKISDKLSFGVNINPSFNAQRFFINNNSYNATYGSYDYLAIALISFPFFSPYNPDGSFAISNQIKANTPEDGALAENIVAIAKTNTNFANTFRTFGNTYLTYNILKNLKYKLSLGGDYNNLYQSNFTPSSVGQYRTPAPKPATAQEINGYTSNYLIENTLTYAQKIRNHDFNILVGQSFQKENNSLTTINASGIPDDNITNINGASSFIASSSKYTWSQVSYFGRVQYNYSQKYIASVSLRADGSSRFGINNKWGYFPSITAGWVASNETFFPKNDIITYLKFRSTWGKSGNNQIGNYASYALVQGGANSNYVFGSNLAAGFSSSNTPNPNLGWETKESNNLGVDFTIFRNTNFTVEYYKSTTNDLLLNVPVPAQSGFTSSLQNLGKIENKGLEIEASSDFKFGKFKWSYSANIAFNQNKVLALAPGQSQIIAGNEANIITKVGDPIAQLYGYQITGVYKTQAEITADGTKVLAGTKIGDYKVADINGDGLVNSLDRIPLGSFSPKYTYGFNSNFAYKNFELSFSFSGVQGRKVYDRTLASSGLEVGEGFAMCTQDYFNNRFDPNDNPNGTLAMPNTILTAARTATKSSTYSIKDASYLRLRNLQFSYSLSSNLLQKLHLSTLRFYITANNLFTITKYKGFNPDGTTIDNSVLTLGQSSSNYPVTRSFLIGVNISL